MIETSSSRDAILSRIRGPHASNALHDPGADYANIDRAYNRAGLLSLEERLAMFEERLIEYDARVFRLREAVISQVVGAAIRERGAQRLVVPSGIQPGWLPTTVSFTEGDSLTNLELNEFDGFVSACTVAIALTGSIVLQTTAGQGPRKLSLIPDYHLCLVFAEQIVETVPEAFDRIAANSTLPTTFISGPSATADIEMTRIKGVHGPRFLDVLIVD
jgi:L-lactate dehydrogenase complex protein LldG